jgi:phosphopantothenoylcysteine decarboxylase/phosphopantothenate--cysteine ligase
MPKNYRHFIKMLNTYKSFIHPTVYISDDITAPDAGFEVDTNRVVILGADGSQTPLALATKTRIAEAIIERVAALLP